jgi:hypothetical protein
MDVAKEDMALSTGFVWPRLGTLPPCCEHGNRKPLGFMTVGEFLNRLRTVSFSRRFLLRAVKLRIIRCVIMTLLVMFHFIANLPRFQTSPFRRHFRTVE